MTDLKHNIYMDGEWFLCEVQDGNIIPCKEGKKLFKFCPSCGILKTQEEFYKSHTNNNGKVFYKKKCKSCYSKTYRKKNKNTTKGRKFIY